MPRKIFLLAVGFCTLFEPSVASELTAKFCAGWSRVDGGDLNKSIDGWQRYYHDLQSPYFSAEYRLEKMHDFPEVGLEIVYHLSPRWGVGIQACWQRQRRSGDISTRMAKAETSPLFPSGTMSITLEETSTKKASFTLESLPVVLTVSYSLPLSGNLELDLGVGGGMAWSRLHYAEDGQYSFNYFEEKILPSARFDYVEKFNSSGGYSEKTKSYGLCFSGRLGLVFKLNSSLSLTAELFGRFLELKNWKGKKSEELKWQQTWGPGGAFSDRGESEESVSGRLWRVDVQSNDTDGRYPRLVLAQEKPASPAFASVRLARIDLSGVGLRIGIAFRFGPGG